MQSETNDFSMQNLLMLLSSNFEYIFYVDFDTDEVIPYHQSEDSYVQQEVSKITYREMIDNFITCNMSGAELKEIENILKKDHLYRHLRAKNYYTYDFRCSGYEPERYFRLKIVNMNEKDGLHHAVIGLANIDNEKYSSIDFYKSGRKILIIEDNELNRDILTEILSDMYTVITAENGNEGFEILSEYAEDIAVIITDLEMPVCNGYEFLERFSSVRQYSAIPVLVVTTTNQTEAEVKCLQLGATDFIVKPYNREIVRNRVKSLARLKESSAMLNALEKDSLTGLYTREFFIRYAQEKIDCNPDKKYCIVCSDIENFKVINDKYGLKTGDDILIYVSEQIKKHFPGIIFGGRINGDIFAFLQETDGVSYPENNTIEEILRQSPVISVSVKFGIYTAEGNHSVQHMTDRAIMAINQIKNVYGKYIAVYDNKIREELMKQQQIIDNMQEALEKRQFKVYYQPKHEIISDNTSGAEALVRWIHPVLGFMNPGLFIDIFEKNGFITQLDEYVWNEVCSSIARWRNNGLQIVPVSINVSRRDFEKEDLAEKIINLVDSYNLPHDYLHIDVTESAYSDNPKRIEKTIEKLHDSGFVIELDDFGTGYSSLAVLNSMKLDILKLDMSLIKQDISSSDRSALVFAIKLAQILGLKTIAEGIENSEQFERVKSLGCDYIQGYFFSKPVPEEEFMKSL